MARTRQSITSGTTENNIYFYPAGGHSHDGQNSTLIDTTKYSVYDFNFAFVGDNPERRNFQSNSYNSMQQLIKDTVTNLVLEPAGIVLQPNTLNAAAIISRTITADLIAANTITANELAANIILVNNTIKSNTYDSGVGWAIYSNGFADFENVRVVGNVTANTGSIGGWFLSSDYIYSFPGNVTLYSNGYFVIGSDPLNRAEITPDGDFTVTGYNSTDSSYGSSRFFGPWFKVVKGSNVNANASNAVQSQLTYDSLMIASKNSGSIFTTFTGMFNDSNGQVFSIVKDNNTEVYISNTSITASNAAVSFKSLGVTQSVSADSFSTPQGFFATKGSNSYSYIGYPTGSTLPTIYLTNSNSAINFQAYANGYVQCLDILATNLTLFGDLSVFNNAYISGSNTTINAKVIASKAAAISTLNANIGFYDSNQNATTILIDAKTYGNTILLPKNNIWMYYPGPHTYPNTAVVDYDDFHAWTSAIENNWYQNPANPYSRWGVCREEWRGYLETRFNGDTVTSRSFVLASDRRVKDNIQPMNSVIDPLNIVNDIEPKIYDYTYYKTRKLDENGQATDEFYPIPKKFGFIAQDLIEALGDYKDLVTDEIEVPNYDFPIYATEDRGILAILWGAVRSLSDKVIDLENRLEGV